MISPIDQQPWHSEIVTGNSQFIEVGTSIYIVSQVRADNSFGVFKSDAYPPSSGIGFFSGIPIANQTASYTFPTANTSFDPVMAYDGTRYIYIVGTQNNASGQGVDVLVFVYDIQNESSNPLSSPTTIVSASYVRDSYDICILGDNEFIAVAVTNPSKIWETPTVVPLTGGATIGINGGVLTVTAPNSYQVGQTVTFTGLQNANFLNNVSAIVSSASGSQFTADDLIAAEFLTVPIVSPYTLTVANAASFLADSKVMYTASSVALSNVTSTNVFAITAVNVAVSGTTTYIGTFPSNLPKGTATITGFTNAANNGTFNVVSNTTTNLVVSNANGVNEVHAASAAILSTGQYVVANGVYSFNPNDAGVKVSIFYSYTPANYTQVGFESGFVTWLPGHSLLGFEMDMGQLKLSPPGVPFISVTVLDSSPFRSGNTFGAVSAYSPDGLSIEVYYESHPKQVTYTDQIFNLNLATYSISPPQWNLPAQTLINFTGRYADARLTVIPQGNKRTLLQQYYSQLVHQNALVGNLLLGYLNPAGSPPTWTFHIQQGSTGTSYIQGTLSVSETSGTFVSYIAEPIYSVRGVWSPQVGAYAVNDRTTFNKVDYIVNTAINYNYQGVWRGGATYVSGAVVQVTVPTNPPSLVFYTAVNNLPVSTISPNLDTANWTATVTPNNDSRFTVAPTAWPLHTNSLDVSTFNMTDVPGFYNTLNFTWLRGSKSVLDDLTKWGLVGEQVGSVSGATYVSDFNVPPVTALTPNGSTVVYRGSPLALNASGTIDGDGDPVQFTWSYSPTNSNVVLTPSGPVATFLVNRSIGGNPQEFIAGVVAVDYNGATPLHPPMSITHIGYSSNTVSVTTSGLVSLAVGEQVFLYDIVTANFLNDHATTIVTAGGSSFTATVNNVQKTELWNIPTTSPYTITVLDNNFETDGGVVYASSGIPLTAPASYGLTAASAAVSGKTTYTGVGLPATSLTGTTATIAGFSNSGNNGAFTVISNTTTSLVVSNSGGVAETHAGTASIFGAGNYTQSGGVYTFSRLDAGVAVKILYTYTFSHAPYSLTSDSGFAVARPQFQFVDISVPSNAAPTIDFTHDGTTGQPVAIPIQAERNAVITINPTYTGVTDLDDATTYTWVQTSGTTIPSTQLLNGLNNASLVFKDNGVLIQGETLVWNLTVNDGVNAPISSSVQVVVAAYPFDFPDTLRLTRAVWAGNISQRNTAQLWSQLDTSALYTNLQSIKRNSVSDGTDRYLLISKGSVSVYGGIHPNMLLLRKLFPPVDNSLSTPASYPVLDAVHTEDDWTFVLDSAQNLYQFVSAPLINTDNPTATIALSSLTSMTFNKVFTTFSYGNVRVVILTGPDGCFLLELRNSDLRVEGTLELSVETGLLFGTDNVQFVRTSNVESLSTGKILLGTIIPVVASITSVGVSGNNVTIVANNSFAVDEVITFANLTQATFLNGVIASVVTRTSTQFTISYQYGNYPVTAEGPNATATTGGKTYETLIDLSHGQIIGAFDASKLRNQFVTTGEILFEPNDTYAGTPAAPKLSPIPTGTAITGSPEFVNVTFTWVADRPDLMQSYVLEVATDSGFNNVTITTINSGFIESVTLPEPIGQFFYVRVKAISADGTSPWSNVQTINTGSSSTPPPPPTGFAVLFGAGFGTT